MSPLRTFAWLSHERPEALRRSINSFLKGCGEAASSYRFIVAESGSFQRRPDELNLKNLTYVDDAYREGMILFLEMELQKQGVNTEFLRFALDGKQAEGTEGAHRNTIALLTQGELLACSDDDIVFDIQALPDAAKRRRVAGESNFLTFKNFSDLDRFQGRPIELSKFIETHETALQSVTFSSPGIRGDSAFGGPRFIFTFDDSSLSGCCENSNFVSEALGSRVVWRETAQSHISSYASLATYMLAMNNRQGLAPCFPFGRNVDGAFIYATKALHPESRTAQLSFSVSHRPLTDRGTYSSLSVLNFRINDFIWLMWSEWLESLSPSLHVLDRYSVAAAYFQDIVSQSAENFQEYLRNLVLRSLADRAHLLEMQMERLENQSAPGLSDWLQIAEKEVQLCRQMAFAKKLISPTETQRFGRSLQEEINITQKWISLYGRLIEFWPVMKDLILTRRVE